MTDPRLDRRELERLALAALGAVLAGCGADEAPPAKTWEDFRYADGEDPLLVEPHVCRGLNTCKGLGRGGTNDCAGTGDCATANLHHCHTMNECRGQGGCGEYPGQNGCRGQGICGVPLADTTWAKARARFEEVMTEAGRTVGPAPAKEPAKE